MLVLVFIYLIIKQICQINNPSKAVSRTYAKRLSS